MSSVYKDNAKIRKIKKPSKQRVAFLVYFNQITRCPDTNVPREPVNVFMILLTFLYGYIDYLFYLCSVKLRLLNIQKSHLWLWIRLEEKPFSCFVV